MATNANWTVIFDDKKILNQSVTDGGHPVGYIIDDDSFWNDSKWSNIWAIQYKDDDHDYNDSVEYRDDTPHATWTNSGLGDFRNQFVDKWDTIHLTNLQAIWDQDNEGTRDADGNVTSTETEAEKIARLGARPTSYSSY